MRTNCEECTYPVVLDEWDADGVLVGGECACGYYVTRYTAEFRLEADWL